jgi:hypothetical protein
MSPHARHAHTLSQTRARTANKTPTLLLQESAGRAAASQCGQTRQNTDIHHAQAPPAPKRPRRPRCHRPFRHRHWQAGERGQVTPTAPARHIAGTPACQPFPDRHWQASHPLEAQRRALRCHQPRACDTQCVLQVPAPASAAPTHTVKNANTYPNTILLACSTAREDNLMKSHQKVRSGANQAARHAARVGAPNTRHDQALASALTHKANSVHVSIQTSPRTSIRARDMHTNPRKHPPDPKKQLTTGKGIPTSEPPKARS